MTKILVLRWGHRLRDERLTTHVALTARALGASGMILSDIKDQKLQKTMEGVVERWGGEFSLKTGKPWRKAIREWKEKGGIVVHLTAYGENIQTSEVIKRIRATGKDTMVIVGSKKVPRAFFNSEISDFNVAIGNQPHSESSSLAVFLDRLFEGKELSREFKGSRLCIIPQRHGKRVVQQE